MVASRPGSAARRRGAAQEESPVLGGALFIPAPLTRPKSALSLRVRSQLSHVKGMATMVSSRTTDELTTGTKIEDLTTGRLVLDRDSEAAIDAAVQEREREAQRVDRESEAEPRARDHNGATSQPPVRSRLGSLHLFLLESPPLPH